MIPLLSKGCQDLIITDIPQAGSCFAEFVFLGDTTFASIMVLILIVFVAVRYSMPLEFLAPAFIGLTFVLWLLSGSQIMLGLFLIGLLIGGALFGLSFLQYLSRG
jgi:hypothetical protein